MISDEQNKIKKIKCKKGRQLTDLTVKPSNRVTFSQDDEMRRSSLFSS